MSHHQAAPDTDSIWRTLSNRLRQFVRSHVASDADVDDILQNVFLRIHRNLNSLRDSDRLESWVFQIARNAITDYHRRKPLDPLDAEAVSAQADDQRSDNLNAEVAGCLGTMIARLPEHLQRAVSMYEQQGLSQNEIASREAITLSGAKSRVQRGRSQLKEMLLQCCQLQLDRYGNVVAWDAPASCDSGGESCKCC
jgi:RNA polymerase sigma-70 factor (ECF subfamily)